jgi:acyl transferase domain-containing protein
MYFTKYYICTKALEDRNKIWGIVQTGTNQDGYMAQPITAPSAVQQEKLLHKLYSQYNVDPSTLQYFECHGNLFFYLAFAQYE